MYAMAEVMIAVLLQSMLDTIVPSVTEMLILLSMVLMVMNRLLVIEKLLLDYMDDVDEDVMKQLQQQLMLLLLPL